MSSAAGHSSDSARQASPKSTVDFSWSAGPGDSALDPVVQAALDEMSAAWRAGRQTPAEHWLERHPQLAAAPPLAVRVIFEEVCLREEQGQQVDSAEIFARFPQFKQALEVVLDCHSLIQSEPPSAAFPEIGGQLGELQLLAELGRGGQGRVFLATQPSLSDRPLVVKITPRSGDEHLSLARLQHTHIAPLYLVQEFPEENLRALCMPYLGGASWSQLLQVLRSQPLSERQGRHIVAALEAEHDEARAPRSVGPALGFLARATYVEAVCWIGSCLADALHYAHQRGLLHLDIKPSNVLLAADGQPMLLDFHLAREVVSAGCERIERLGGTRGHMSSEQEACAAAVREGRPMPVGLDGRSDIYALGVLLFESLSGHLPPVVEPEARRLLRQANPHVSRGLEDVLLKCLARDPAERYADAGQLATDLRCHLAGLPLRGVPNRNLRERWRKWRRRKPHALVVGAAGVVTLAVVMITAWWFREDRLNTARQAIAQARQNSDNRDFVAAMERAEAGRNAIRWIPGQSDLRQALKTQLGLAHRAQLADALNELVEKLRFVDGFQNTPEAKLRQLEAGCRKIWQARNQIAALDSPASDADTETQLSRDLLDLALLWSRLRVRLAADEQAPQERRAALAILDEAEALCRPHAVLELARREYRAGMQPSETSASIEAIPPPQTAWEHYSVGRFLLQSDELGPAQQEFERAIALEPDAFWPNFYLTLCAYRQQDFEKALHAAYVCVALAPRSTECYFNRALCQQAAGHRERSYDDFTRALELDPTSAVAALHRGILLREMERHAEALADLKRALDLHASPALVYYQMALVHLAEHDPARAQACLNEVLRHTPTDEPALSLKRRLDEAR